MPQAAKEKAHSQNLVKMMSVVVYTIENEFVHTRRMLERILPSMLACTILISPFVRATILTYWLCVSTCRCGGEPARCLGLTYDKFNGISKSSIKKSPKRLSHV